MQAFHQDHALYLVLALLAVYHQLHLVYQFVVPLLRVPFILKLSTSSTATSTPSASPSTSPPTLCTLSLSSRSASLDRKISSAPNFEELARSLSAPTSACSPHPAAAAV